MPNEIAALARQVNYNTLVKRLRRFIYMFTCLHDGECFDSLVEHNVPSKRVDRATMYVVQKVGYDHATAEQGRGICKFLRTETLQVYTT